MIRLGGLPPCRSDRTKVPERTNGAVSVNAESLHRGDSNPPDVALAPRWAGEFRICRVSFFGPRSVPWRRFRCAIVGNSRTAPDTLLKAGGEETCPMAYCITLRSRTDTSIITGWYADSASRWSTDHRRLKLFDDKYHAGAVCRELRNLCPRNAEVINIEVAGRPLPAK